MRIVSIIVFTFFALIGNSQNEDVVYENYVYVDYIKSVDFGLDRAELSKPIINLNSRAKLILRFDDITGDTRDFTYDVVHCDRNWEPSDLDNMEYIDGFTNEDIDSIQFSVNTFTDYTHYALSLPNDDLKWTLSGNYLLIVNEELDGETFPVLTLRFMVIDQQVQVNAQMLRPFDVTKYDTHQEFDFRVNFKNVDLQDPLTTITAVALQNYRWDNAIYGLKPKFVNGDDLVFNYSDHIIFPGVREFRVFDTRSLRSSGIGVHSIHLNDDNNHVLLDLQESLHLKRYLNHNDANGDFVNYTEDSQLPYIGADYANVIFTLDTPERNNEVYVVGGFNNYQASDENQMHYSEEREAYVAEIMLKQGYYDYMFAELADDKLDLTSFQGSWQETENRYLILIYYSNRYNRYDQLIGISIFDPN
jgi:hypothetical protein